MTEKHLFRSSVPIDEARTDQIRYQVFRRLEMRFFFSSIKAISGAPSSARKGAYSGLVKAHIRIASPALHFCRAFTAELLRVLSNRISSAGASAWKRRRTTAFSLVSFTLLYVEGGHSWRIRG